MTVDEFRGLALSFPESVESSHMGHPDFRIGGKIFATIAPDSVRAMVKLKPEQQQEIIRTAPAVFEPASGAWGERGATMIELAVADEADVLQSLTWAYFNTAPKKPAQ